VEFEMKLSYNMQQKLLCPITKDKLNKNGSFFESNSNPNIRYPIIDGIPILINDKKSIFSIDTFVKKEKTTFDSKKIRVISFLSFFLPKISVNITAKENYKKISTMLSNNSTILIIGGSIKGQGMDSIYSNKSFEIVGADVAFGPQTNIICDAHEIPFENNIFDCVIIQAVLEHVLDPQVCIGELIRVLKPSGLVYAETPFMQ
jgi:SAM-dependent methyltransferase